MHAVLEYNYEVFMKNVFLFLALLNVPALASDFPFTSCKGVTEGHQQQSVFLNLVENDEEAIFERRPLASKKAPKLDFVVSRHFSRGFQFTVETSARVYYAGSGSLDGKLSINLQTMKGTWVETSSHFEESTGLRGENTLKFQVTCK